MKHARWMLAGMLVLSGCTSDSARTSGPTAVSPMVVPLTPSHWTVATSSTAAAAMSADDAKAVLIARGYIEEQARKQAEAAGEPASQPQFISFQPRQTADGWDVYVEFVGTWVNDKPRKSPGHSTVVRIDHRWKVTDYEITDGSTPASRPSTQPGM